MLKMTDVLEHNLVQNFTHSLTSHISNFDEQLNQGILNASALQIQTAISTFFIENDANEVAQALDITPDRLHAIQTGAALSNENLNDTAKLVALCLALETNALAQVEIAECLQDYPM